MKTKFGLLFGAIFLLSSCSLVSRKDINEKRPQPKAKQSQSASDSGKSNGFTLPEDESPVPVPPSIEAPKVAVVLGPGGFKTFAYASFVKALQQSGVPTDKIVGVEWGALVAGFWALNAQPHEAEWKVFKLDDKIFDNSGFFNSKSKAVESSSLRKYLSDNLTSLDLKKLKVPFTCPTLSLKTGALQWPQSGSLAGVVESCLISPPQMKPGSNQSAVAALFNLEEIAKRLKREGYGVIILVNVLGNEDFLKSKSGDVDWVDRAYWLEARRSLWNAKKYYTDVIDLNTSAYSLYDLRAKKGLSRNSEAIGKKVGRELVEKYKF